ncbi:MAG: hypothetical protein IJP12_02395 [Methanobrevibacter sp.]|nr:hypothetical protein [Methanobrevibacter sp.]
MDAIVTIDNKKQDTMNFLKGIYETVKSRFDEIINKKSSYGNLVKNFLDKLEKIADSIEENPFLDEDIYFDFLTLKRMIRYILNDVNLSLKYFNFILDYTKQYIKVSIYRIKNKNICDDDEEYYKLIYDFNRKKEYFYTYIYEHQGTYDDLIDEFIATLN